MAEKSNLLLQTAAAVGLDDDIAVLQALGDLAQEWVVLAEELKDFDSAIAFAEAVADGANSQAITNAFKKIGAEGTLTGLQQHADKLKELLDKIPAAASILLQPIGNFDERQGSRDAGRLNWPILNRTVKPAAGGAAGKPEYALSLQAEASLVLEAGDTWPYSDPMPHALLRMGATGKLAPTGSASLPFSAGKVSASASATGACTLEYFFAVPDTGTLYAVAAAKRLAGLPDPFDFEAVWAAFENTDLAGIHYELEGDGELKVAVSLADSAALGELASAQLGATVSVGFKLGGKYFLTFRADPRAPGTRPKIVATLSRQSRSERSLGAQLGITVDAASLAQKVHQVLAGALAEWEDELSTVKEMLAPGTWLQKQAGNLVKAEAEKLISNKTLRDALVGDLQGVIGIGDIADSKLAGWLEGQLAGAVDRAAGWAQNEVAAATSVLDTLGRSLPALAIPLIGATLKPSADILVTSAKDALKAEVEALFGADRAALGKALKRLGATSTSTVANANAALAGVLKLVERYEKLFRKVLAETENAVRSKMSASIQIEESRQQGAITEIEGTFLAGPEGAGSEGAREAFKALTRGNIDALMRLIEGEGEGFAVDREKSKLTRHAGSRGKVGVELVLFGFGMTGSVLLTSDADVMVDGTGKVQVDAKATLEKTFKGLDAERRIELVSAFSLTQARALATAPLAVDRAIGLAVTVGHVDDNLKRHEIERFVSSLVDGGLISQGAFTLAKQTFTDWAGSPGSNRKLAASLVLKLSLDRRALSPLLGLDDNPAAHARKVALAAFASLRRMGALDDVSYNASLAALKRDHSNLGPDDLLLLDRNPMRLALQEQRSGPGIRRISPEHEPFWEASELARGLREMTDKMRQIYLSTPEVHRDDVQSTWSPSDYRDMERATASAVRDWLVLNDSLFWTNSLVHGRTLAFLDAVTDIAGLDQAQPFSLTMTRTDKDASPETVVLTRAVA